MTFVLVSTCPLKPNVFCHSVKPAQCIQNERNYFQLDIIAFASSSICYARAEKLYFWPFCVNIALRYRWRHFRRKYWLCKQTEQIILKYRSRVFVPYRFHSSWSWTLWLWSYKTWEYVFWIVFETKYAEIFGSRKKPINLCNTVRSLSFQIV